MSLKNFISPVQRGKLPAFVRSEYPAFETYMMKYFQWLEQDDNFIDVLERWRANNDASTQAEPYITAILRDLGWTWEGPIHIEKTVLLATLRDFYLSRGTKKSFRWLFRVLFNEAVEVEYPRERLLVPSYADYTERTSVFVTADNLATAPFTRIFEALAGGDSVDVQGIISGITATVETFQIQLTGNEVYVKLGIIEPEQLFIPQEDVRIISGTDFVIEKLLNVAEIDIEAQGYGHTVGTQVQVTGAGLAGVVRVTDVNGGGITSLTIDAAGEGYVVGDPIVAVLDSSLDNGFGFFAQVSAVGSAGEITAVAIKNKGMKFDNVPRVIAKSVNGVEAELTAGSNTIGGLHRLRVYQPYVNFNPSTVTATLGNATLTVRESSVFREKLYRDRLGVLGENCIITDSDRFQQFSYDLLSIVPGSAYNDAVEDLLHPVGYIRTNVAKVQDRAAQVVTATGKVQIEQQTALTFLATLQGDGLITQANDNLTVL